MFGAKAPVQRKDPFTLRQPRSAAVLLAKLIAPENRMEALGDDHQQPNIDLEYVGARGLALHLLQELQGLAHAAATLQRGAALAAAAARRTHCCRMAKVVAERAAGARRAI